jgi:hypothetical protein
MAHADRENKAKDEPTPTNARAGAFRLLARHNRGIFFDILVFLVNLFLMRLLTRDFITIVQRSDTDRSAAFGVFLYCLGLFILPPAAAILKRYPFQQRLKLRQLHAEADQKKTSHDDLDIKFGCIFNPLFYLSLTIVVVCAISAFIQQFIKVDESTEGAVAGLMAVGGLILAIAQTVLVYRFFTPPKKAPKSAFWLDPRAEAVGDLCAFLNILLYQLMWNTVLGSLGWGFPATVSEFSARIFFLIFVSLLLYFPPRIFFLAEDIKKPAAWASILLANSPLIIRVLFGVKLI